MDIKSFGEKAVNTTKIGAMTVKNCAQKMGCAIKNETAKAKESAHAKKENAQQKMSGIISSANAIPLNIKKKAELAQIAHKEAFRKEALVAEARSNGASKKEAKKGAEALMCATGTHTHKNAEDSAKVFEKAGKSAAEYAAEAAERKDELKNKFGK